MTDQKTADSRHKKTKHQKVDDVGMSRKYLKALEKAYSSFKTKNYLYISDNKSITEIHNQIKDFIRV